MSNTLKIYTLAILSFLVGTSENIIAGILDKISASLQVSVVTAGQLITVFSLAYAIGVPIVMALTSRMERKKLLLYALIIFIASNLLAFLFSTYEGVVFSRVLMGVSAGVTVVSALTIAAKIAKPGREGSSIAAVLMGFTASLIFGVPIGRMLSAIFDWRSVFLGISVIGLFAVLILIYTIPRIAADTPVSLRSQLGMLKQRKTLLALSISFFWIFSYGIFFSYISPFLLTVTGMNDKLVSTVLLALGIASLIGSRSGGAGTDKYGIAFILYAGLLLSGVMLLVLAAYSHSPVWVMIVLAVWSFAVWAVGPPQQLYLITLAPESSGMMLSLNNSVIQVAMAAGASVGGLAVNQISLSSITWISAVFSLAGVWMVYLTQRKPVQTEGFKPLDLNDQG